MSGDLRAAVEGLHPPAGLREETVRGWYDALGEVLVLIPEGAVLVTEETLGRCLDELWQERWGPLPLPKGQTTINLENAAAILRHLREGT